MITITWLIFALSCSCSDQIIVDDVGEFGTGTMSTSTSDTQTQLSTDSDSDSDSDSASDTYVPGVCGDNPDSPVVPRPADVIAVVDNSAKMETEIAMTEQELLVFYSVLEAAYTQPQLTLISGASPPANSKEKNGLCLSKPLGSGECPKDSSPPEYVHLPLSVGSKDALSILLQAHDDWKDRIRAGGDLHLLVISDDDSEMTAEQFTEAMSALDPPVERFFFHAIAPGTDKEDDCALEPQGPCCEFSAHIGAVYKELVQTTGGIFADLCRQDFASEFSLIAEKIIQTSCRSSAR